ncbi:MAG: RluA family pseudouridine synthase, partial [bacterium]|nr:RluA family pseudouridine synthase [bacterium]
MRRTLSYQVKEEDVAHTVGGLVNFLLKDCLHLTGREVSRAKFLPDGIMADGVQVTVKQRLRAGQILTVCLEDTEGMESRVAAREGALTILYEDEDIVFVDKPAGVVVHPSHGHFYDSVGNYLAYYYEQQGMDVICRVIGRLDKDTSGVLLFAKNQAAAARMTAQKQNGKSSRTYYALVQGHMPSKKGEIHASLERVPDDLMLQRVSEHGLPAHTTYEVVQEFKDYSLLSVKISTGRTHQIRVHMASVGHPLLGDPLYGTLSYADPEQKQIPTDGTALRIQRAALHSAEVICQQPFTGEIIKITSPLPEDMR